jgi:hypothetical protein
MDGVTVSRSRRALQLVLLAALVVVLSGCVAGANDAAGGGGHPDGFWFGLWHGVISPVMFVVSLFRDDVGIYEIHNNGGWYDFGFMFGVSIVFSGTAGSSAAPARRRRRS